MKKHDLDKQKSSPHTCIPVPKQSLEKRKNSKTHQTNIPSQTIPSNPIVSTIQKDSKMTSTYRHRLLKQNPKLRNSISSKEDFRRKNVVGPPVQINFPMKKTSKRNQINPNTNHNNLNQHNTPQLTGNSNCVLTTNYSDKEEEKKTTKNTRQEITLNSLKHLGNLFRSSNFKQTIIIDDEGNNNLNLDLKHLTNRKTFIKNNIERNPLTIDLNTPKNEMPIKIEYNKYNSNHINNHININEPTIHSNTNTNQVDNRLNEYKMIFNLLNSNIEQMKTIIENNNIINTKDINRHKEPQDIPNRIISPKDVEEINKITHNELRTDTTNHTIALNDNCNNNAKINSNNHNNSFLDSCINEEFYQSFVKHNIHKANQGNNNNEKKLNLSFEYSTILPKNELFNNNSKTFQNLNLNDQTECENYEDEGRDNRININTITPHFLFQKANTLTNKNVKQKSREPSIDAVDKNSKCLIF